MRAYTFISLGNSILTGVMSSWLLYFYLPPSGNVLIGPMLFGIVILIIRVVYVLLSIPADRLTQRQPLFPMLVGAFCMPLLFTLLWSPPNQTSWNGPYFFIVVVAYNLAAVFQQTAYEGFVSGITVSSDEERETFFNWRMSFLLLGNVLAGFAGPLIEWLGYVSAIRIFAVVAATCLMLPALLLYRRYYARPITHDQQKAFWPYHHTEHISLLETIKVAFGSQPFRVFALTWGLMWLASTFTFETLPYIATEICRLPVAGTAWLYFASLLTSLAAYPVMMKLARRFGARVVFRTSLFAGALTMPLLLFISESIPLPLLIQGLVWIGLQSTSLSGALTLPGIITAEISSRDYSTIGNLLDQLASGLALLIIPIFFLLGYNRSEDIGPIGIRLLGLAGGGFLLLAWLVFGKFGLKVESTS